MDVDTGLTIESAEASQLARELAELTGESLGDAVTVALRQRLDREREKAAKLQRIMALAQEIRAHMTEPVSSDHSWLYDENGFPK